MDNIVTMHEEVLLRTPQRTGRMSDVPGYTSWKGMKERCHNPSSVLYPMYGGRGIKVCPKWLNSFDAFIADMGERPSTLHSIDRIGNSSPYAPWNCRWATGREQQRNRRVSRIVEWKGEPRLLLELGEEYGISDGALRNRLLAGWSLKDALTRPIDKTKARREPRDWKGREKLTPEQVAEMRQAHAAGESRKSLAERFGIRASHVHKIVTRMSWKDVP